MIQFPCSECGKKLSVGESAAGKLATCPTCKTRTRVPEASDEEDRPKKSARPSEGVKSAAKKPARRDAEEEEELEPEAEELEDEDEEDERPRKKKSAQVRRRRDEDDEDEDEEPRRKKARARRDDDEDEDEEDEDDRSGFTANRIRGVVALVVALALVIFGLTFEKFKDPAVEYGQYGTPVCCGLGGLLVLAGIYYLIRG
jgi:hypothetical protein